MSAAALLIAPAVIAPALVLTGCVVVTKEQTTAREVARYARVMTLAKLEFEAGGLSRADVDDDQIMFAPYSRVPGKPVTCRSDVVVGAAGAVSQVCTVCTDDAATGPRAASEEYARTLHYTQGADGRRGQLVFAFTPQRPDGSLIVPRIPAPQTACEPQPVST